MSGKERISMSQKELDRYEIVKKVIRKELMGTEASRIVNVTYRHFKRLKSRVKNEGAKGLIHGNRGRPGNRRLPKEETEKIIHLLHKKYPDFKPGFAAEKLEIVHGIKRDPKTIRAIMIEEKLWKPKRGKKKKEHRIWRQRKEYEGELVQFDGSYHDWFEAGHKSTLLASIDDATGKVNAVFDKDEGVFAVFGFWKEYIREKGAPRAIYTDKFSTYKMTQQAAGNNHDLLTQFQRAAQELKIALIIADSPEAKGRVERLFGTLQDRLIKEMRLKKIKTMDQANRYLKEEFLPEFNRRFGVKALKKADLHRKLLQSGKKRLDSIFSRQTAGVVQNDFTISFQNQWYQLTDNQPVTVRKKDRVIMEEHPGESIKIHFKGKYLNYKLLTERPIKNKKTQQWVPAKKPTYKPAPNHPWKRFAIEKSLSKIKS